VTILVTIVTCELVWVKAQESSMSFSLISPEWFQDMQAIAPIWPGYQIRHDNVWFKYQSSQARPVEHYWSGELAILFHSSPLGGGDLETGEWWTCFIIDGAVSGVTKWRHFSSVDVAPRKWSCACFYRIYPKKTLSIPASCIFFIRKTDEISNFEFDEWWYKFW
jgi:hypothetical protein